MEDRFTKVLTVRISEAQAAELRAKASKEARPAGEIVRELIDGCLATSQ